MTSDTRVEVGEGPVRDDASLRDTGFVVVVAVQLAMILAMGAAGIALPALQDDLGASDGALQWFAALFMLGFALVLVLGGRLGDIHGTRRLLLVGFGGFVVATAVGAVAPTMTVVLLARLAQGVAGGLASPQLLAIIQRRFDGHAQARAFAVFMTVAALAFMLGQLAAGSLISSDALGLGWRWAFLVALPLGVVTWPLVRRLLPADDLGVGGEHVDWTGAVVLAGASLLVLFPLIQGQSTGWPPWLLLLLVASLPAFGAFVSIERRATRRGTEPLVDLALFRVRSFGVGNLVGVVTGLMSFAEIVYVTLTLQDGFGYSALGAAALTAPIPFANMFGSLAAAPMLRSIGRGAVAVGGVLTGVAALALIATLEIVGDSLQPLHLVPGLVLLGFALGISVSAAIAITLAEVPERNAGSASGVQSTVLQLASAVGIAVYGIVFFGVVDGVDGRAPRLDGLNATLWVTAVLCLAQVALTPFLPRHVTGGPHPIPVADPENLILPDLGALTGAADVAAADSRSEDHPPRPKS